MPRPAKIRVGTETDKRKAEIFNHIDDLIINSRFSEALENLNYLFRNAPSLGAQIHRKFAWLFFKMKNYKKSLIYLQQITPTNEVFLNRMAIESLLQLDMKEQAIWHLAKAPIDLTSKRQLLYLIFPELETKFQTKIDNIPISQTTIRCHRCTRVLFFTKNRPICLFCDLSSRI